VGAPLGGETVIPLSQAMLKAGTPINVPASAPPIPDFLVTNPVALAEWDRVVEILLDANAITALDVAVLASYCLNYALWVELAQKVEEEGVTAVSPKTGAPYIAPWFSAMNQAQAAMNAAAAQLALSPKARAGIRTTLSRAADQERKVAAAQAAGDSGAVSAPEGSRWAKFN
jgi:P27 family predicted phage terminase small subunit